MGPSISKKLMTPVKKEYKSSFQSGPSSQASLSSSQAPGQPLGFFSPEECMASTPIIPHTVTTCEADAPPAYTPRSRSSPFLSFQRRPSQPSRPSHPRPEVVITQRSIPQWLWTTVQSRQWLLAILVHTFNVPEVQAREMVEKFEGNGVSLFLKDVRGWKALLGNDRGEAIAHMIFTMRDARGAVPKDFEIV